MITDAIIAMIKAIWDVITYPLDALGSLWPTIDFAGLGESVLSLFDGGIVGDFLAWANFYAPVAEAMTALGLLVALYAGLLAYRTLVYVLSKLHILGGSSA